MPDRVRWRPDGERSRGQVLSEFAIVIPLFMLIVLVVAEGGYYAAATTVVSNATHEGARLGVLETTSSRSTIRARVRQSASAIVPLANDQITLQIARLKDDGSYESPVSCDNTCYGQRRTNDRLIVRTAYDHVPLVGYVFPGLVIPSDASAEMTVEGDPA